MPSMIKYVAAFAAACIASAFAQSSAPKSNAADVLKQSNAPVKTITKVFSQLITYSLPKGFVPVFEDGKGNQYIQEAVLAGETTTKWTQMITLTGAKELVANPNVTPMAFANRMAEGFKQSCPASFNAMGLGPNKINGFDAFGAILSCGVAMPSGTPYSETMLLLVIKGERDYYTLQWAERGAPSQTPIKVDEAKWAERMRRLAPVRLCPIVPGEAAPYPSCLNRT